LRLLTVALVVSSCAVRQARHKNAWVLHVEHVVMSQVEFGL